MNDAADPCDQNQEEDGELVDIQTKIDDEIFGLHESVERNRYGSVPYNLNECAYRQSEGYPYRGTRDFVALPPQPLSTQSQSEKGHQREKWDQDVH